MIKSQEKEGGATRSAALTKKQNNKKKTKKNPKTSNQVIPFDFINHKSKYIKSLSPKIKSEGTSHSFFIYKQQIHNDFKP